MAAEASSGKKPLLRLLDQVVAHGNTVFWALSVLGVLGFLAVPLLERHNHFDENALLAGSATPTFRTSAPDLIKKSYRLAGDLVRNASTSGPSAFHQALHQQGLEVSYQQFTAELGPWAQPPGMAAAWGGGAAHSSSSSSSRQQASRLLSLGTRSCTNMHAILRSSRGDGKEALLLVTPLALQPSVVAPASDPGAQQLVLALGLALLSHLAQVRWLAKDLIWVIPDASCGSVAATQAWADHYVLQDGLTDDPNAFARGGIMQQAVVLEAISSEFNHVQLLLEGYDGLLPKLDTFWLLHTYTTWWGGNVAVQLPGHQAAAEAVQTVKRVLQPLLKVLDGIMAVAAEAAGFSMQQVEQARQLLWQHLHKVVVAAQFVYRQARGLPLGPHAAFRQYGVDVATMRLLRADGQTAGQRQVNTLTGTAAVGHLGDVLESALRSCSVLVERFHHSYFLYILTDELHFVTVERYIVPVVLLIGALLVQAAVARQHMSALQQQQQAVSTTGGSSCVSSGGFVWARAFAQTALSHCGCLAVGLALRVALQVQPYHAPAQPAHSHQQQQEHLSGPTPPPGLLTAAVDKGVEAVQGLLGGQLQPQQAAGAALLVMVAGALMAEAVRSLVNQGGDLGDGHQPKQQCRQANWQAVQAVQLYWMQVRCLLLSCASAVLTAVACLNWALAYTMGLLLVPLTAAGVTQWLPQESSVHDTTAGSGGSGSSKGRGDGEEEPSQVGIASSSTKAARPAHQASWQQQQQQQQQQPLQLLRLAAWVALSPGALIMLWRYAATAADAGVGSGADGAAHGTFGSLVSLLVASRWTTYCMFAGLYVPFWLLTGGMLHAAWRHGVPGWGSKSPRS